MKHISLNIVSAYLFAATTLLFSACSKDDSGSEGTGNPKTDTGKDNTTDDVVTGGVAEISFTTATIYGYVNNSTQAMLGMGIAYDTDANITKKSLAELKEAGKTAQALSFDPGTENRQFTVHLNGLTSNTTYYYYAYAGQMTGKVLTFKTPTPPVMLKVSDATDITPFAASLHGSIDKKYWKHGFVYSQHQDLSDSIFVEYDNDEASEFTMVINKLLPNTTYYYRSCASTIDDKVDWDYHETLSSKDRLQYLKDHTLVYYSDETLSFTTQDANICPDNNHPHAINLFLPSGTRWACCDVEATQPENKGKSYKCWLTLSTFYDYAEDILGNGWKVPETEQGRELINNTTTVLDGQKGIYFVSNNRYAIYIPLTNSINENSTKYWLHGEEFFGAGYVYGKNLEIKDGKPQIGSSNHTSSLPIRPVRTY